MKISNVLLLPNPKKEEAIRIAAGLSRFITESGRTAYVLPQVCAPMHDEPVFPLKDEQISQMDLLVPLGGDGTILGSIRKFKDFPIPILGVNLGDVGFLAEVEPDNAEEALTRVFNGEYHIEERILLEGQIDKQDGSDPIVFSAMNDVLINRHMMASLIQMDVSINGQLIDSYLGDGLLICTPTGSTAYNLSAGGPIVAPSARNLVITPICVHSLNVRSIVTSEEDEISVKIGAGKNDPNHPSIISIDGQKHEWLICGDKVTVRRSSKTVPIIKLGERTFYQTLKQKLF